MTSPYTPIEHLVENDSAHVCSINLFPFVNRSLNAIGKQARVVQIDEILVYFIIIKEQPNAIAS